VLLFRLIRLPGLAVAVAPLAGAVALAVVVRELAPARARALVVPAAGSSCGPWRLRGSRRPASAAESTARTQCPVRTARAACASRSRRAGPALPGGACGGGASGAKRRARRTGARAQPRYRRPCAGCGNAAAAGSSGAGGAGEVHAASPSADAAGRCPVLAARPLPNDAEHGAGRDGSLRAGAGAGPECACRWCPHCYGANLSPRHGPGQAGGCPGDGRQRTSQRWCCASRPPAGAGPCRVPCCQSWRYRTAAQDEGDAGPWSALSAPLTGRQNGAHRAAGAPLQPYLCCPSWIRWQCAWSW
jgi:hypothetical protein